MRNVTPATQTRPRPPRTPAVLCQSMFAATGRIAPPSPRTNRSATTILLGAMPRGYLGLVRVRRRQRAAQRPVRDDRVACRVIRCVVDALRPATVHLRASDGTI